MVSGHPTRLALRDRLLALLGEPLIYEETNQSVVYQWTFHGPHAFDDPDATPDIIMRNCFGFWLGEGGTEPYYMTRFAYEHRFTPRQKRIRRMVKYK